MQSHTPRKFSLSTIILAPIPGYLRHSISVIFFRFVAHGMQDAHKNSHCRLRDPPCFQLLHRWSRHWLKNFTMIRALPNTWRNWMLRVKPSMYPHWHINYMVFAPCGGQSCKRLRLWFWCRLQSLGLAMRAPWRVPFLCYAWYGYLC